jgi:hypothetical protein
VKIIGICSSCFTRNIFGQKPDQGLCIVCPNCGAILESLYVIPSSQDWPFEDGNHAEKKLNDPVLGKQISEEIDS